MSFPIDAKYLRQHHPDGACLITIKPSRDVEECVASVTGTGIEVRAIDARKCYSADMLFAHFSSVLGFPDYFGGNWDAFSECLCDHELTPRKPTVVFLLNADEVLAKALDRRRTLARIFDRVSRGLSESGYAALDNPDFPPLWIICVVEDRSRAGGWLNDISNAVRVD